ncbi:MAG: hypothetical protein MJZ72_00165 [Bacteroidales bacterium]|nr:hypothetical protein [Bacteroidales bacterium]
MNNEDKTLLSLDLHCQMIVEEYRENLPIYKKMQTIVMERLHKALEEANIIVNGLESRIKAEKSLIGKLHLKGSKYNFLSDLTDILGARVITYYTDEVDKIAAIAENIFDIDWQNSVDKRKKHELNSFGYMSLHYICRIPKSIYEDPEHPEINELRFELQMRTALQHVWANIDHDIGYKTGVEIPPAHLRNLNRLAGMLELADEQFSRIRREINDYRRQVQNLVDSGNFNEIVLNGDTFRSYLTLNPFRPLAERIAAVNQAEIFYDNISNYFQLFQVFNFKTIGDIEHFKNDYADAAFQFAVNQIAGTDLDIIAASVALQDLFIVYILKNGFGIKGLETLYNTLGGNEQANKERAQQTFERAKKINIVSSES